MARTAMPRQRGFTLVEMLVALFIMAMVAILSWRGIDGMARAQAATRERADQVLALQNGLAQWSADLDALVQFRDLRALDWNGRVLRLTRRDAVSPGDGVHVVGWTRRDGQWLRWQSNAVATRGEVEAAWQQADFWAQNQGDAQRRQEVAIAPLEEWQLFYYRGDAWTNPQSSDAQTPAAAAAAAAGVRTNVLPDGVRLELLLPPGRALAGRIT
ncbi:MAG: prepilin-type N-terminal cleavage/methylation domain-containing protein, partial [Ramlibacter sp.]|nr:prepilin-type N-terminal cleavage/methylation domain-containing protein [Ramlibacter sp.]